MFMVSREAALICSLLKFLSMSLESSGLSTVGDFSHGGRLGIRTCLTSVSSAMFHLSKIGVETREGDSGTADEDGYVLPHLRTSMTSSGTRTSGLVVRRSRMRTLMITRPVGRPQTSAVHMKEGSNNRLNSIMDAFSFWSEERGAETSDTA